jgi:hypothetical protein
MNLFFNYIITNKFDMSFTRFHDDPNRIRKQAAELSYAGKYALNTPGPGDNIPFLEDPQVRLQTWGANLMTNTINLESDLRGLTRKLNRDEIEVNDYKIMAAGGSSVSYPVGESFVDESRASHPAWMYRDLEQTRWEEPLLNPQAGLEKVFHDNIQTRILEKDYFTPRVPVVTGINSYYLSGNSNVNIHKK